jgi:hypothetical protein
MKMSVFLFASLFLMAISAESVKAQNSATATANATASIIGPLWIAKTADLNFGAIVPSSTAGTVAVGYDNSRTGTGGVTLISQPVKHSAATFMVSGRKNKHFDVILPDKAILTREGGMETMTVSTFTENAPPKLDHDGEAVFSVGATLVVAAYQAGGVYNATFDVTVTYN